MGTLPFTLAKEIATQLITLAVGIIGLTITFVKEFDATGLVILVISWAFYLFCIIFGVLHFMALAGQVRDLAAADQKFTDFAGSVVLFASLQILCFALGCVALLVFGCRQKLPQIRGKP